VWGGSQSIDKFMDWSDYLSVKSATTDLIVVGGGVVSSSKGVSGLGFFSNGVCVRQHSMCVLSSMSKEKAPPSSKREGAPTTKTHLQSRKGPYI
jgi:hypothetical protein